MKKLIMCAAVSSVMCGAACAQSNVTIYGVADAGFVRESGGPAGSINRITSGVASGSRLGFKGKEALGGGVSAFFQLENGYNIDTGSAGQGGLLFGRQALVGLSGAAGTLSAGRQYSPLYTTLRDVVDPFEIGLAGNVINIVPSFTRVDNMVEYVSPRYAGFAADLAYGFGESAGDSAKARHLGAALSYVAGPLNVTLAHHVKNDTAAIDHARYTMLVGKYTYQSFTLHVAHGINKALAGNDSKDVVLGGTYGWGANKLLGSFIVHDDSNSAGKDARQWALGYLYALSKRSDLYLSHGRISNRNGAVFTVGNGTEAGTGNRGTDIGMRHRF